MEEALILEKSDLIYNSRYKEFHDISVKDFKDREVICKASKVIFTDGIEIKVIKSRNRKIM